MKLDKEMLGHQNSLLNKYASVGKLAAGIVHEINNPLDGIIRYTNMLLVQPENNSVTTDYLLEIKKGLERMTRITKSLLEFSRYANCDSPKGKTYADVHQVIDESIKTLHHNITSSAVEVRRRYDRSIPAIVMQGIFYAFSNIIRNAVDAMPQGGVLEIATEKADGSIKFRFTDTGHGIPYEVKERIFEPFFTTKSIDKGSGLGLAICKEIINKYEGKLSVDSVPGNGATFTVEIPLSYFKHE